MTRPRSDFAKGTMRHLWHILGVLLALLVAGKLLWVATDSVSPPKVEAKEMMR